jgi:ureidoglycolate lyase
MTITATAPDAGAFAPFGAFIDRPARPGERRAHSAWLDPVPGFTLQFYTNRVAPSELPLTLALVERHPHAAQVFLPLRVSRYLVTVMGSDATGAPDTASARAFVVPSTLGIVYRAGTWHAGITALDDEGSLAMLMWRGAADDDVFVEIPPLVILPPSPAAPYGGPRV